MLAQPKAIGIRIGATGTDISYQHSFSTDQFIALDAGLDLGYGVSGKLGGRISGTYNFIWAKPKWTKKGTWNIYAGPGLSAGWVQDRVVIKAGEERSNAFADGLVIGAVGQVGIDYRFEIPLQLALEVRPCIGMHFADKTISFYDNGFLGFIPALAIRYSF